MSIRTKENPHVLWAVIRHLLKGLECKAFKLPNITAGIVPSLWAPLSCRCINSRPGSQAVEGIMGLNGTMAQNCEGVSVCVFIMEFFLKFFHKRGR